MSRNSRTQISPISPINRTRAVIYCRKSTDRDDKQQNSLDSQLDACNRTVSEKSLEVVETILESASAKEEWKRPQFARMLEMCRVGKVDYIVVDEVSRLTRNTMDGARIIGLLEKKQILAVFASSRSYFAEQANDHFMLQLDAGIAKLDNELRRRNVKARMITCAEKGRWLGKAPFGYKNTVITQNGVVLRKNISIDPLEWEMVRKIFNLRVNHRATLKEISIACKKEYGHLVVHSFNQQTIKKIWNNKAYIGIVTYSGKQYKWEHEPLVDAELFWKAQEIGQARVDNKDFPTLTQVSITWDSEPQYYFKGLIKDTNGILLTAQVKKGRYVYYNHQSLRSSCKVNVSQKEIFRQAEEFFEQNRISSHQIAWMVYSLADHFLQDKEVEMQKKKEAVMRRIETAKARKQRLLEGFMDGVIDSETYRKQDTILFDEIEKLESEKVTFPKSEIEQIKADCKKQLELPETPFISLKWKTDAEKMEVIKKWMLELKIDNKKTLNFLTVEGFDALTWPFNSESISCSLDDGSATENRTPVYGMKTRCPNH